MKKTAWHVVSVCLILCLVGLDMWPGGGGNSGDDYPSRSIKLVVPFNPGGGSDLFGRTIQQGIVQAGLLPQPLAVINRPGASATIGSRYVKDARPDGFTMLLLHNAIITAQYSGKVNYGPEEFDAIAGTGEIGMVIAVHESSRFQTLQQLLDEAKNRPDTVLHGVNLGAPTHFAALKLENASGAKFRFTQAGDGADRFSKLKEHIDVAGFSVSEFLSFRSEGLRGLALLDFQRNQALKDVPTAIEQGCDVTELNSFYWWFPKGTPQDRIEYMAGVLEKAMRTDYVREKLGELSMDPRFFRGDEFQQVLDRRIRTAKAVGRQETPQVANIPLFTGVGLLGCLVMMISTRISGRRQWGPEPLTAKPLNLRRPGQLLLVTAVYVTMMQYQWLAFPIATSVYIAVAGLLLTTEPRRIIVPLAEVALIVGFGINYALTNIVVTDLP